MIVGEVTTFGALPEAEKEVFRAVRAAMQAALDAGVKADMVISAAMNASVMSALQLGAKPDRIKAGVEMVVDHFAEVK